MKNLIPLALAVALLTGAAVADTPVPTSAEQPEPAARLTGETDEYLIGPITRDQWERFAPELVEETRSYQPGPDLIDALAYGGNGIEILCVLGTWCSDSRREVPRVWKILDLMGAEAFDLRMIAVGRGSAPEALDWEIENDIVPGYRSRHDIEFVPTFIVLDQGEELGRIIETPEISLEADLATILGVTPAPRMH